MPKLPITRIPASGASKRFADYRRGKPLPVELVCDCPACRRAEAQAEADLQFWVVVAIVVITVLASLGLWVNAHP